MPRPIKSGVGEDVPESLTWGGGRLSLKCNSTLDQRGPSRMMHAIYKPAHLHHTLVTSTSPPFLITSTGYSLLGFSQTAALSSEHSAWLTLRHKTTRLWGIV